MKNLVWALTTLLVLACGASVDPSQDGEVATENQAKRIDAPFYVPAYYDKYSTSIVGSQKEFNDYKQDLTSTWLKHNDLKAAFDAINVDFNTHNLVAYSWYEPSGSITITPHAPQYSDNRIHVNISRFVPDVGTADIASYLLMYTINKGISHIHFDTGTRERIYKNKPGRDLIIENCGAVDWCTPPPKNRLIERIQTPFREHGYSNFNTLVLGSQAELDYFTKGLISQDGWNNRENFIDGLLNANINFDSANLLIYRMTESSGSNKLEPNSPDVKDDIATVNIKRTVPDIGTDDLAFYALAYSVDKTINEVHFIGSKNDEHIPNKTGRNIAPNNCTQWFDGCNECQKNNAGLVGCTKKLCQVTSPLHCKVWK